jgi:hypothetical protein
MQNTAPQTIGRKKISENFEGPCPAQRKKVPTIFEFAPPKKYDKFQKAQNTAEVTVLGFFKK